MLHKLSRLKLLSALTGFAIIIIAGYLWHRTTAISTLDWAQQSSLGTDWGKQSCDNFDGVRLKISKSKQRETALLSEEDVNTLFACRLYEGLGK